MHQPNFPKGGLTLEPRMGQPEDIGKVVAALLRGDLPYATGQILRNGLFYLDRRQKIEKRIGKTRHLLGCRYKSAFGYEILKKSLDLLLTFFA